MSRRKLLQTGTVLAGGAVIGGTLDVAGGPPPSAPPPWAGPPLPYPAQNDPAAALAYFTVTRDTPTAIGIIVIQARRGAVREGLAPEFLLLLVGPLGFPALKRVLVSEINEIAKAEARYDQEAPQALLLGGVRPRAGSGQVIAGPFL